MGHSGRDLGRWRSQVCLRLVRPGGPLARLVRLRIRRLAPDLQRRDVDGLAASPSPSPLASDRLSECVCERPDAHCCSRVGAARLERRSSVPHSSAIGDCSSSRPFVLSVAVRPPMEHVGIDREPGALGHCPSGVVRDLVRDTVHLGPGSRIGAVVGHVRFAAGSRCLRSGRCRCGHPGRCLHHRICASKAPRLNERSRGPSSTEGARL